MIFHTSLTRGREGEGKRKKGGKEGARCRGGERDGETLRGAEMSAAETEGAVVGGAGLRWDKNSP